MNEDEVKSKKRLKKWQIQLIIVALVLIVIAVGFIHQAYIRSNGYITKQYTKYKADFDTSASYLMENIPAADKLPDDLNGTNTESTFNWSLISTLVENSKYDSIKNNLSKLSDAGFDKVRATSGSVVFRNIYSSTIIYMPSGKPDGNTVKIAENWYYDNTNATNN